MTAVHDNKFLHILPWVMFVLAALAAAFFVYNAVYAYNSGKLLGASKFEANLIMVLSIIMALVFALIFVWSIIHLFQLYSRKKKPSEDEELEEDEEPAAKAPSKSVTKPAAKTPAVKTPAAKTPAKAAAPVGSDENMEFGARGDTAQLSKEVMDR